MREINQDLFQAAFNNGKVINTHDCRRIATFARALGIFITLKQAEVVWDHYSSVRDAQWLRVKGGSLGTKQVAEVIEEFIEDRLGEL